MFSSILKVLHLYILLVTIPLLQTVDVKASGHEFITLLGSTSKETESSNSIEWNLEVTGKGFSSIIKTNFSLDKKNTDSMPDETWQQRIEIDGNIISQDVHRHDKNSVKQLIPLDSISDGTHEISMIVLDFGGKTHTLSRKFNIKATPQICVKKELTPEKYDPQITLSYFGERDGVVGTAEFSIDYKTLNVFNVQSDWNNKPKQLSDWVGSTIYLADLAPGNHLLTIKTVALNGRVETFTGQIEVTATIPEINIKYIDDEKLESIEILFPDSSNEVFGYIDIFYYGHILFSKQSRNKKLIINKDEITEYLEKFKRKTNLLSKSIDLVISTRTINNVENWKKFSFK